MDTITTATDAKPAIGANRFITEQQLITIQAHEYSRLNELARRTTLPVIASHTSALRVLGIELPERYHPAFDPRPMHIAVGSHTQLRTLRDTAIHMNHTEVLEDHTVPCAALFSSVDAELALIQMAGVLDMLELVVLGDCMMRRGVQRRTTKRGMLLAVQNAGAFHGKRKLLKAIPLMRSNTDSSYETRTRIALACRGLGTADVNAAVTTGRDTPWSVDMAYPELMVAVEYDGRFHMTDVSQGEHDKEKRGNMRSRGWDVHEVTKSRLATPESRDMLAADVATSFGKALDVPIHPLPCIPLEQLADRRRRHRAAGLEIPQLERHFSNPM